MVDSMFHLRRIHFQSYVTAAAAAAAASCKPESKGKAAAKTPPSDQQQLEAINDKTEPTKNPELRNNSTFILLDKVTKIGRNPELVDVVLNSIMHSNMISRDHSELVGELDENQRYKYSICDKSLNGTYPGEYAPQQTAEFIFRFERAIPGHKYFGYTIKGIRLHPEKTRAYMQISSDRVAPHEAFPATVTKVLPQATIASANATVAAVVSLPASTSTPLSCSSTSTTSDQPPPWLMQQHQHAAAASALAAAANLSADDVAAVSAHLRTVAAADALNSWNSSLYQLTLYTSKTPPLWKCFSGSSGSCSRLLPRSSRSTSSSPLAQCSTVESSIGQGAATASNTPTDWVQFNQQKAASPAAKVALFPTLTTEYKWTARTYALGPQVTSNANCLPTSSNSGFMPQILSPCAIGVVGSSASGGYGGVITSANATSSMGSSMAGPMKPAQQYQLQQRESPSISAKLAAAAASATKEELEAATRAAAAWPSIPPCSSASSTSARTQLPPSLASVLPAALAARQAGDTHRYCTCGVSNNTMNGGPVPTSVKNQNTPPLNYLVQPPHSNWTGDPLTLHSHKSGHSTTLPIKLEQRSRNSSTSLSSISSHSTFTNRGPTNNLAQSPNQPEVSTEDLMSKASCSSVTEPTPTATTINSLAAAISTMKEEWEQARVAGSQQKSLKRTKTADLDLAKGELNGGDELKQLQLAAAQAASLASEVLERPAFVRTPDAAGEEVLPPSSIVVKMMECDSTTGHNGQHNNENASDSVASNLQDLVPTSPPFRYHHPELHVPRPERVLSRLPVPASSAQKVLFFQRLQVELDQTGGKRGLGKSRGEEDESGKGEKPKPIKQTRKSNEVARLLNDLTAGNCSWQHQAERTIRTSSKHCNGDSAQPDLPNGHLLGSADRKREH
uniref:FHA domain-containing protein n=1 Tax=Ditylenchus dipsaci TaxID=166011 RepID=A0A915D6V3_9BILA